MVNLTNTYNWSFFDIGFVNYIALLLSPTSLSLESKRRSSLEFIFKKAQFYFSG